MKHIYLNLKRFDVPVELGGVNRIAPVEEWGSFIVKNTQEELKKYDPAKAARVFTAWILLLAAISVPLPLTDLQLP